MMKTLGDRLRQAGDQLLELVVPKATAEAAPPPPCRAITDCWYDSERRGTLYWDELHDTSCGCWLP